MEHTHLLFIQNRAQRAGAQTSLFRITLCDSIRALSPSVLTASRGWLNEALEEKGVTQFTSPWPSPRSLQARIGGLKKFAHKIAARFSENARTPTVIIANDHQECLVALAISKTLGNLPVFAILRSSGMSQLDFKKYQCGECSAVFPHGKDLTARVKSWTSIPVYGIEGSFSDDEKYLPVTLPEHFPDRILVAGSEDPHKGFSDFIDALAKVEQAHSNFPALTCVMTGTAPENLAHDHNFRSRFEYVGRVDNFVKFAREFPLAIHPSRSESFGLAPLELLLAGIPTLVSKTGVIDELCLPDEWCFAPNSPRDMADRIAKLWQRWPDTGLNIPAVQKKLLDNYSISDTTDLIATVVQTPDSKSP